MPNLDLEEFSNSKKNKFQTELNLNKKLIDISDHNKLFLRNPIFSLDRKGFTIESSRLNLKDKFGYISFEVSYTLRDTIVELKSYCFRFVHNSSKVHIVEEDTIKAKEDYGFHIDKDTEKVNHSHPPEHLSHNYLNRPRIEIRGVKDELEAFDYFINLIKCNFFNKDMKPLNSPYTPEFMTNLR